MKRQEIIDLAVSWALETANGSGHGYDQARRWGPDYDCSSFVISAWDAAGVPVKARGASYTGNMRGVFIACGFFDVTDRVIWSSGSGLQKGDVLLNTENHTELYIGNGQTVKASINEKGTVAGGQIGDQTGREICVGSYYNYPWDCILRYMGDKDEEPEPAEDDGADEEYVVVTGQLPVLAKGDKGTSVLAMQAVLIARGFKCGWCGADGDFGADTEKALLDFQRHYGLEADGVCGPATWACLLGVRK